MKLFMGLPLFTQSTVVDVSLLDVVSRITETLLDVWEY